MAVEFVNRAVELVGARNLIGGDDGAGATAIFRAHGVSQDRKVLDGLERGVNVDGAFAEVVIVVGSVEEIGRSGFAGAAGSGAHVQAGGNLRREKRQGGEDVAVRQRRIFNGGAINLSGEIRSGGLHEHGLLGDLYHLAGLGQFEFNVEGDGLAGFYDDFAGANFGEVRGLHVDNVFGRRNQGETGGNVR